MGPFGRLAESQPLPLEEQQRQELVYAISNNASNPTADRSDARVIDLVRRGGLHGYTEALASYVQCSMPVLEALLAAGADPNATGGSDVWNIDSKFTHAPALCASIYDSNQGKLNALLTAGADPNSCLKHGNVRASALSLAIKANFSQPDQCYAVVEALLRAGANPDGAHDVPLAFASAARHRRVVQLLLVYGANTRKELGFKFDFGGQALGIDKEVTLEYLSRNDPWDDAYGLCRNFGSPLYPIMRDVWDWESRSIRSDAPEGASPEQHAASRRAKGTAAGAFADWDYSQLRETADFMIMRYQSFGM